MPYRILLVDDDAIFRESLLIVLQKRGFSCDQAKDGREAYDMIRAESYDIVISDIEMPRLNGMELMDKVNAVAPHIFFIVITAYATMETAIEALRHGAFDYIIKPFKFDSLILKLNKLIQHKQLVQENARLRQEINYQYDFNNIIGQSDAMNRIFKIIRRVSESESNVLITGKSGTGKELVARAIHYHSPRRSGPFVTLNCNAVPDTLIESELFGHRRGSFTGAHEDRPGLFRDAAGGTLFLDEIGDVSMNFQLKLLRAIEQKEILPIGSGEVVKVDVRIIAATNRNLEKAVQEGRFREDLYYRLNVIGIPMPPLSERRGDIPLLVNHFISRFNRAMGKNIRGMTPEAMKTLENAEWRGEVRELENIIERAMIFTDGDTIGTGVFPEYLHALPREESLAVPDGLSLDDATRRFQLGYIRRGLESNGGHRGQTAKMLKISEPTLYRRLQEMEERDHS